MVEMLGPLPARPPTPPRPGSRHEQGQTDTPVPIHTPRDASHTAISSKAPPSSRGSKRVTFSPWLVETSNNPHPTPTKDGKPKDSPYKSILKESNSPIPVWSPNAKNFTSESLAMLLESVSQQLASGSVTSRLDAYMQFFGALRTYDGLPAVNDIKGKLNLITDYIQRDVTRDLANASPLDTNLVIQSLKLCATFFWHSDIAPHLSDEFKVFILDRAIITLEEATAPKNVITHYSNILSMQDFGPRVLTTARITRLLTALKDLNTRVAGKAISMSQISIYQRLLVQSKAQFISQAPLWVAPLVSGILNHVKETRTRAIQLGLQVSSAAGPNQSISRAVRELFDRPMGNGQKLIMEIRERLSRMTNQAEAGVNVPQSWSVIVLLLRSKNWNWDQWEYFKEWVLILQKCFNCSDPAIKAQAAVGWNRFVFAVCPSESTSRALLRMLIRPIISQLERKKSDKSTSSSLLTLGSYHNLLYYSVRPSSPRQYLDFIWDEYVVQPSISTFSTLPALSDNTSRVLANMLWSPQAKLWTGNRIYDAKKIEPEELPSLDPQWVRSSITSILTVFESLFKASVWDPTELHKSNVALAWVSLSNALSVASSKEITPSTESMQVVASILSLLCGLWNVGLPSLNVSPEEGTEVFFERFKYLSATMISSLGAIPFTERLLVKTHEGTFQTSNTPTHRQSTSGTNLNTPVLHLLTTIRVPGVISGPTLLYTQLVEGIIEASSKGRSSRGSRLELLQQFSDLRRTHPTESARISLDAVLWKASARTAADALQSIPIESARERDGSVSSDYVNVTQILKAGLEFPEAHQEYSHLLSSFARVVRTEKGDQALPSFMIEPMAKNLSTIPAQDTYMPLSSLLSHSLSISTWSEPTSAGDQPLPSTPVNLLNAVGNTLKFSYDNFSVSKVHGLAGFIESLTSFLGSGALPFRTTVLETLQPSLGPWIQDEKCQFDVQHGVDSRILTACRALTSAVLNILQTSCVDLTSAQKFEGLICAGLRSPHTSRSKRFVEFFRSMARSLDKVTKDSVLGQSLQAAQSKLEEAAVSQANSQITNKRHLDSLVSDKANEVGINSTAIPLLHQQYLNINSSPVIGNDDQVAVEDSASAEPVLPVQATTQLPEELNGQNPSSRQHIRNRQEAFRLIDGIHSSSPANTPGRLGFDTPVHLRRFHGVPMHEAPLTPTLAAAENEDGFIGSSPTPATRDPTPASMPDAPSFGSRDASLHDTSDVPSSPPEMNSNTPSPRKKSRRSKSRRKSSREKKAIARKSVLENGTSSNPISLTDTFESRNAESQNDSDSPSVQADERPPSRRTRSALSQSMDNVQNIDRVETAETPSKADGSFSAPNSKSKPRSASRDKKKKRKRQTDENQEPVNHATPSTPSQNPDVVDSSSDDLEEQIASQLEQDLELAVDFGSFSQDASFQQASNIESVKEAPSGKKRKRTEDAQSTAPNSRRRSTRLSTANDINEDPVDDADATQSQEADAPEEPQAATVDVNPPSTRRSTRGLQQKEEETVGKQPTEAPKSSDLPAPQATQPQDTQVEDGNLSDKDLSQPEPKRPRKSLRSQEQSTPNAAASSPALTPKTRGRSRKTRSQRRNGNRQSPQDQQTQVEPQETEARRDPSPISEEFVPESVVPLEPIPDHFEPLISTEEATDSQVTNMDPGPEPASVAPEAPMEIDQEPVSKPTQTNSEKLASVTAAGVQTERSTAENSTSEAFITSSLKKLLENMKSANLSPTSLREVDDLLFNIRVEAHDASRRHNSA